MNTSEALYHAIYACSELARLSTNTGDVAAYGQAADVLKTMLAEQEAMQRLQMMNRDKFANHYMLLWSEIWEKWECRQPFFDENGMSCERSWMADTPAAAINAAWAAYQEAKQ